MIWNVQTPVHGVAVTG